LSLARTLGHRRIVAYHSLDNPASGRVLRKVGFCPTGEIGLRRSRARGMEIPVALHAIDLGEPSDCDDDGSAMTRRAA
jgi:RimJ/RimL family protein N-acetyltransferase